MKIWSIVTPEKEYEIEVADSTLLYGQHLFWNQLIRHVDDFFNNRNSQVEIFEGSLPINNKDWRCFFIPYDANVQLSKIKSNSPLKDVQNAITEQLTHSPLFQELLDIWSELDGEFEFINQRLRKWGIQGNLSAINEKDLANFVSFNPVYGSNLSPLDVKKLLLNIVLEKPMDKKTLIIVELPELFASEKELWEFKDMVDKAIAIGYQFLFVSQNKNYGIGNFYYKKRIINSALFEEMKRKVCNEVPFYCSESLYEQAKKIFLRLVDNSISEEEILKLSGANYGMIVTIIHVMMYNLNMETIQVPQGLEPNLKKFISDLN
ncbi:hypothetical protein ACLIA0_14815 [Bacillaceae bacterium W0354]